MGKKQWLIAAVGLILLTAEAGAQQAVRWQPTLESAKRAAGQSNRLVLVHFWAPWCEACRRMDRDVFGQAEVAAAMETGYVAVKLNADHHPATAQQYRVKALPTQVVITPQGQLVEKFEGALGYAKYIEQLQRIAAANRTGPARPAARVASAPPSAAPGIGIPPSSPANQQPAGAAPYSDDRYANYFKGSPGQTAPAAPRYGQPPQTQPGTTANPGPSRYGAERPVTGARPGQSAHSNIPSQGSLPNQSTQRDPVRQIQPPPGMTPGITPSRPPAAYTGVGTPPAGAGRQPAVGQSAPAGGQSAPAAGAGSGNPPLGLDGYCPVELTDNQRWQLGDRKWGAIHRGRTYLFTGSTQQQRFLANPDHYSPIMAGNDVVLSLDQGQSASGLRRHGVFFDGRVYLFSSESSLEQFSKDPNNYANRVLQSMRSAPRPSYR